VLPSARVRVPKLSEGRADASTHAHARTRTQAHASGARTRGREQHTHLLEGGEVSDVHGLHDLQVGPERHGQLPHLQRRLRRHLAHEQLHDRRELCDREPEAYCRALRRLARGLQQAAVRLGVVELDRLDPAEVVEVARQLVVRRRLGEPRLGHELVGLRVRAGGQARERARERESDREGAAKKR
jgi:hypothetical protein